MRLLDRYLLREFAVPLFYCLAGFQIFWTAFDLFSNLKSTVQLPIFITQHMPPTFTTILAERISRLTGGKCTEAVDGELVK